MLQWFGWESEVSLGLVSRYQPQGLGLIFGDQGTGHAVIGAHVLDIMLHDLYAGRLPEPDCCVQGINRCLFQTKWRCCALRSFVMMLPPSPQCL